MITYLCCIYVLGIVIIGCDPKLKNIRRNNIWHFYTPIHVLSQDNHSNQNDWHTLNVKTVESSPVIFCYYEKQCTIYILHFWLFYKLDYFILLKKIQTRDPIMRSTKFRIFDTHNKLQASKSTRSQDNLLSDTFSDTFEDYLSFVPWKVLILKMIFQNKSS